MFDQSQFSASDSLDPILSTNIGKYIAIRLEACKSDAEKSDVNLFAKILYQVISSNDNPANEKNSCAYKNTIIALLKNNIIFTPIECAAQYDLEQAVLMLSIANFKSCIADNFTHDSLVQQATNELCKLVEDNCTDAVWRQLARGDSSSIANTKSQYYLAIHAIEASHQYAVQESIHVVMHEQKSSNRNDQKYVTDYANISNAYPKLITRIQGTPKANAFLVNLGVGLTVLGCALSIAAVMANILLLVFAPLSFLAITMMTDAALVGGIGSLGVGSYLSDTYNQHAWSRRMGFFSKAIIASKPPVEKPQFHSQHLSLQQQ